MTIEDNRTKTDESAGRRGDAPETKVGKRPAPTGAKGDTGDLGGDGLHRRINNETPEDDGEGRNGAGRRADGSHT